MNSIEMIVLELNNKMYKQGNTPESHIFYQWLKETVKNSDVKLNKTNIKAIVSRYNKLVKNTNKRTINREYVIDCYERNY